MCKLIGSEKTVWESSINYCIVLYFNITLKLDFNKTTNIQCFRSKQLLEVKYSAYKAFYKHIGIPIKKCVQSQYISLHILSSNFCTYIDMRK